MPYIAPSSPALEWAHDLQATEVPAACSGLWSVELVVSLLWACKPPPAGPDELAGSVSRVALSSPFRRGVYLPLPRQRALERRQASASTPRRDVPARVPGAILARGAAGESACRGRGQLGRGLRLSAMPTLGTGLLFSSAPRTADDVESP